MHFSPLTNFVKPNALWQISRSCTSFFQGIMQGGLLFTLLYILCHQSAPKNLNTSITITLQLNKFKPNTIRWQHLFCLRFRPISQGTSYDCSTQGGLKFNADKSSMLKYFIHKRPLSIFFSLHGNFVNRKT